VCHNRRLHCTLGLAIANTRAILRVGRQRALANHAHCAHCLHRIGAHSRLAAKHDAVGAVEQRYDVSVVMIHSSEGTDMHPPDTRRLKAGDSVAVFGAPESVNRLAGDNVGR